MVKGKNRETFTGTIDGLEKTTDLEVSPCKVCASEQAKGIEERFVTLSFGERPRITRGVHATFLQAGHIPGSASIFIEIERLGKTTRVLFSGDLGNDFSRLQRGPPPAPEADFFFVESTYGAARSGIDPLTELQRFHQEISERISNQEGIVWIPAFALDRTQKILYEIEFLKKEGKIPKDTPVYCPSPLAKEITGIYHENKARGWFKDSVSETEDPFGWERGPLQFRLPRGKEKMRPHILVTTSGMMGQAYSRSLLAELLPKNNVSLLIVGYQSDGTPGREIEEGARFLEIDGRSIPVNAKVLKFHCFSGHASAEQIDRWLKHIDKDVPLFLVHGEPESLKVRQNDLAEKGHSDVKIPELMKKFNLGE
jgi:metallo-beta-lactamase family protein